jgi:hypothetical protein
MAVYWVVAPCSLVEVYHVSEVLAASIIRALNILIALMMEAARTSETLVHGATTQKTAIFVLTAVTTSNPTQNFYLKVCIFYEGTLSMPTQGLPRVPTLNRQSCTCFFLYVCKTRSLVLRKEQTIRVYENRVVARKWEDVTGGWRKLHNVYSSSNIINIIQLKRMRWEGSCSAQGRSQMHTRFWLENLK